MSVSVFISLSLVTALAIYYWIRCKFTYFKRRGFLSKKPTLLQGNLVGVGTKFHYSDILKRFYDEYKNKAPAYGLYQFMLVPSFVVTDLDVIKDILIKDFDCFRNRDIYHTEDDVLSNHIFFMEDEPWKRMRNNVSPMFTRGKINIILPTVVDISNKLVDYMEKQNDVVEMKEVLARFTTDVIANVAFGLESNSLNDPNSTFRKMGIEFFSFDRKRQIRAYAILLFQSIAKKLKRRLTPTEVSDFFISLIRDTVDYRRKNKIERNDFLDWLMKVNNNGNTLTLNEITAQCFVFWLGGFETSSSTATFCLYFLSIHQDVQEKLRTEIQTVLSKCDNQITYETLTEMKYLQMVIDETLRLFGPAHHLMRRAEKDYKIPNTNLVIPKGGKIAIPINAIHTDPDYYPEPNKFIPERFSEENKRNRHPMAHIPWGSGPRICIGLRFGLMQTKISLIQLLMKFKFSPSSRTPIPMVLQPTCVVFSPRDMYLTVKKL